VTSPVRRRARVWWTATYSRRQRRYLIAIVLIALAVRLAWVIVAARPPVAGDPVAYMFHGETIARGQGYRSVIGALQYVPVHDLPQTAFYPIGYPGTLAALFWIVLHTPIPDNLPMAVGIFQALIGVGSVILTSELARRVFGSRVAVLTAAVMAVWPNLVSHTAQAQYETVFIFLSVAALAVIVRPWPRGIVSWRRSVAFGAVLGVAALVRPTVLMLLPVLVVCWVVAGGTWRRALVQAAIAAAVLAVVVAPWLARNTIVMHSTVFSTGIGDALCDSRHPDASGQYEIAAKYCLDPYEGIPLPRREVVRNRENTKTAVRFVLHHPLEEARLWFWRGYFGYRDDHDTFEGIALDRGHPLHGSRLVGVFESVSDAYYFVVLALAWLALRAFLRRKTPGRAQRLCLLLAGAQAALVPFLLFGDPRYKIPVFPFFAIGAAVSLSRLWAGSTPRRRDAQD
jgi:4-amino-4-deoxy-L-arabinose transferase-like glycosyltransferase